MMFSGQIERMGQMSQYIDGYVFGRSQALWLMAISALFDEDQWMRQSEVEIHRCITQHQSLTGTASYNLGRAATARLLKNTVLTCLVDMGDLDAEQYISPTTQVL